MNNEYRIGVLPSLGYTVLSGLITTAVSIIAYQLGMKDLLLMVVTMLTNAALLGSRTCIPNGGKMAALYSLPTVIVAYIITQEGGNSTSVNTLQVIVNSLYGASYGLALGIALGLLFKRKERVVSLAIGGITGFFLAAMLFHAIQLIHAGLGSPLLFLYNVVGCVVMLKGAVFIEEFL